VVEKTTSPLSGSLEVKNGFYVLHLWGSPEEMGRAHGTLLKDQIKDLVQRYLFDGVVKGSGVPWETLVLVARNYEAGMPGDFKTELHGIAEGAGVSYEAVLVGQLIMDLAAVAASMPVGCSSFIAKGGAASGEAVIHGANLEWGDYDNALRDNLAIIFYEPSDGNKFISLSYAGGAGVLIGMNEKHIANSVGVVNAGYSLGGRAATVNLRKMLQYSNNLSEAAAYLTESQATCGYAVPVSCGSPEGLFVMEICPGHYKKREAGTVEALVATNHFISDEMRPYQIGSAPTASISRFDRLSELVAQSYSSISESLAKSFMSDRNEPSGDYINSNYVIYSAVLLPKDLAFWVAKGPVSSEASYVAFNLGE
jgi:hypothetical protein